MIIETLLDVLYTIFDFLTTPINIPALPTDVFGYFDTAMSYLQSGYKLLNNWLPITYFVVLYGIILAVDGGIKVYHFVMWVLKKIPMLGIQ